MGQRCIFQKEFMLEHGTVLHNIRDHVHIDLVSMSVAINSYFVAQNENLSVICCFTYWLLPAQISSLQYLIQVCLSPSHVWHGVIETLQKWSKYPIVTILLKTWIWPFKATYFLWRTGLSVHLPECFVFCISYFSSMY